MYAGICVYLFIWGPEKHEVAIVENGMVFLMWKHEDKISLHFWVLLLLETVFEIWKKMGRSRVQLCRCGAEPNNRAFFSSILPPPNLLFILDTWSGADSGVPVPKPLCPASERILQCPPPPTVSLLNLGLPFLSVNGSRGESRGRREVRPGWLLHPGKPGSLFAGTLPSFPGQTLGLEGMILYPLNGWDPSPLPDHLRLPWEDHKMQNVFSIRFKLKMGIKIDTFSVVSLSHNIFHSLVPPLFKNSFLVFFTGQTQLYI